MEKDEKVGWRKYSIFQSREIVFCGKNEERNKGDVKRVTIGRVI